jgi:protocatechuate 3,4-dioxygenase beta subunit
MNNFGSDAARGPDKDRKPAKAPSCRRRYRIPLVLEALEDRWMPAVTISGYVFNDLNNDSIMQPGEPAIPNNPIELLNSSNVVIGSTTTDGNGYYQFDHDATVSPNVQTITKTLTIPLTATDFSLSGVIGQFNPALGALQSVNILNAASITSDIRVENTSTSSPSTITAMIAGDLTLTGPNNLSLQTNLQQNVGTFNATTYDGTLDFGGTSGKDFGNQTASGRQGETLTVSAMSAFIGTGTVMLDENAHATSTASGGGNVLVGVTSEATATITVTYSYIADNSIKPGSYTIVELATPPGYFDGRNSSNGVPLDNAPGNNVIPVTVVPGVPNYPLNEFGKLKGASLSGYVYGDISAGGYNDGIMQPGEQGIAGVVITLSGTNDVGAVNITTTTNANGYYLFNNLRPGIYSITESHPAGWIDGKDTIGTPGGSVGADVFSNIHLTNGFGGTNNNFGELKVGELSGRVFNDSSAAGFNNGVQDPGEPGIAGVTISLSGVDYSGAPVTASATTDQNGDYKFSNLAPGTYTITKTPPPNWLEGKQVLGTLGGQQQTDQFTITMPAGGAGDHYNFAELVPSTLEGYVYLDTGAGAENNDGIKEPDEPGLGRVVITLTGTNDLGSVQAQTVTAADGHYSFTGLRPGTYALTEQHPATYIDGKDSIGNQGGLVGADLLYNINLAAAVDGINNNFAELVPVISPIPPGVKPPPPGPPLYPPILSNPPSFVPINVPVMSKGQLLASTVNSAVIQSNADYINSIYTAVLGRTVDSGGLVNWLNYLDGGGSRPAFVQMVWNSTENRTRQIVAVYQTILGASPDPGTVNFYLNMFNSGANEAQVVSAIAASPQATALYPTSSDYITELYHVALGRTPSQADLTAWAGLNLDRQTQAMAIFMSQESLGDIVQRSYQQLLGRAAGSAEIAYWTSQMQSGVTFGGFIQDLLDSGEFASHVV